MKRSPIFLLGLTAFLLIALFSCSKPTEPNQVSKPTFSSPSGNPDGPKIVTITCETPMATIYYTLDGVSPNSSSTVYSGPISISKSTTLKARALREGWADSGMAIATYNIPRMIAFYGGTFNNGTSDVTVSLLYIDKYELTQAEYEAVMGTNPSYFSRNPNHPVERVSWFNAIEYCNRRSILEGLTPCYSYLSYGTNPDNWPGGWNSISSNHTNVSCNWTANGYRLPTEAEWEYAARGGNQTHNYTYSGSNTIGDVAWYDGNVSPYGTKPVGTKAANELGLYDMSGNVWEWNWDIYGSYPGGAQTNPHGAVSGSNRVLRGGGWGHNASYCTVSVRNVYSAAHSNYFVGLRLVRFFP